MGWHLDIGSLQYHLQIFDILGLILCQQRLNIEFSAFKLLRILTYHVVNFSLLLFELVIGKLVYLVGIELVSRVEDKVL